MQNTKWVQYFGTPCNLHLNIKGGQKIFLCLVWGGGDLDGLCSFGPVMLQLYQLDGVPGALLGGDYGGLVIDGNLSALQIIEK